MHVEIRTSSLISILIILLGNHYKEKQIVDFSHINRESEERKQNKRSFYFCGVGVEDENLDTNS